MHRTERTHRYDLRSLYETSSVLSSSLDLDFVMRNLLLTTMSKLLVMRAMVLLYQPIDKRYRVAGVKGLPGIGKDDELAFEDCSRADLLHGEDIPDTLQQYGIALVLGIRYQGKHLGLVSLGPKGTHQPFDEAELEFVQSLVHMSAGAIHNSLMVEELRQANRDLDHRVQQLNTLFDLSKEFNASQEQTHLVRLFSFALMGQMMANRHIFFLKRAAPAFDVISSQGIQDLSFSPDFFTALTTLALVDHSDGVVNDTLRKHGLALALPLKKQDEVLGVVCLGPKLTRQPYEPNEVEFLYSLGSLAVTSIQNADLVEARIEQERLSQELRLAREIQQGLLPDTLPPVSGLQIATMAIPSREVGGDYFDVLTLSGGRLHVIIADVTGKGMPAALLMSSIHACTHIMLPMDMSLEDAASNINRVIYENTPPDKFITAFTAIYHPQSRELQYVNAGHEPPLLIRADGTIERLEAGGLLFGVLPSLPYQSARITLHPGDIVVTFTDGVTEAMGDEQEEYTEDRLKAFTLKHRNRTAQELLDLIQQDVEAFTGPVNFLSDDRTMIIIKSE